MQCFQGPGEGIGSPENRVKIVVSHGEGARCRTLVLHVHVSFQNPLESGVKGEAN